MQLQLRPLHEAILNGTSGAFFAEDLLIKSSAAALLDSGKTARFTVTLQPGAGRKSAYGVGGVLVTAVETTDGCGREEALRISEERFARHLRADGASASFNVNWTVVSSSSTGGIARVIGRTADELLTLACPT